jgi:hypothetical protein
MLAGDLGFLPKDSPCYARVDDVCRMLNRLATVTLEKEV